MQIIADSHPYKISLHFHPFNQFNYVEHVNQLYVLSTILKRLSREASTLNKSESVSLKHKSQFLVSTGQRWEGYMYGKNAEHNWISANPFSKIMILLATLVR